MSESSNKKERNPTWWDKYKFIDQRLQHENTVKWVEFGFFITANAILVNAYLQGCQCESGKNIFIPVIGVIFSFLWIFKALNTLNHFQRWKRRKECLIESLSHDEKKDLLPLLVLENKKFYPEFEAKYFIFGFPILTFLAWGVLVFLMIL